MVGLVSVFSHLTLGSLLVALDFLVFSILDQVQHQVTEDIVARAGEFFCIIPSYVADHPRKRLAAPVIAPFEKMKREFQFNVSPSGNVELDANSSRSLHQVSQDITAEMSSDLQVFQKLAGLLPYVGLILLICSFLRMTSDGTINSALYQKILKKNVRSSGR